MAAAAAGRSLVLLLARSGGASGAGGGAGLTARLTAAPGGVSRHRPHRTELQTAGPFLGNDIIRLGGNSLHGAAAQSLYILDDDYAPEPKSSAEKGLVASNAIMNRWINAAIAKAYSAKVHQRLPIWLCQRVAFCSTSSPSDDVSVVYQNGLPVITISLPSRREQCRFTLKPISDTVGVFLQQVQAEDRGIDRVAIYSKDGERIASATSIEVLLLDDFKLSVNDKTYHVRPPKRELLSHEDATTMNDLKTLVQQLYSSMRVEEHQLNKEQELYRRLEVLREQLEPLEQVRLRIAQRAAKKTRWAQWGMLAYMSVQFGVFARLTWWEYSWDIMEPVTYFVTYGTGIAGCAYYILTGREYMYADASDRQFLHYFHRAAKKENFDVIEYNRLKDAIAQAELDLKRLRDPLQLHLPIQQIEDAMD